MAIVIHNSLSDVDADLCFFLWEVIYDEYEWELEWRNAALLLLYKADYSSESKWPMSLILELLNFGC